MRPAPAPIGWHPTDMSSDDDEVTKKFLGRAMCSISKISDEHHQAEVDGPGDTAPSSGMEHNGGGMPTSRRASAACSATPCGAVEAETHGRNGCRQHLRLFLACALEGGKRYARARRNCLPRHTSQLCARRARQQLTSKQRTPVSFHSCHSISWTTIVASRTSFARVRQRTFGAKTPHPYSKTSVRHGSL